MRGFSMAKNTKKSAKKTEDKTAPNIVDDMIKDAVHESDVVNDIIKDSVHESAAYNNATDEEKAGFDQVFDSMREDAPSAAEMPAETNEEVAKSVEEMVKSSSLSEEAREELAKKDEIPEWLRNNFDKAGIKATDEEMKAALKRLNARWAKRWAKASPQSDDEPRVTGYEAPGMPPMGEDLLDAERLAQEQEQINSLYDELCTQYNAVMDKANNVSPRVRSELESKILGDLPTLSQDSSGDTLIYTGTPDMSGWINSNGVRHRITQELVDATNKATHSIKFPIPGATSAATVPETEEERVKRCDAEADAFMKSTADLPKAMVDKIMSLPRDCWQTTYSMAMTPYVQFDYDVSPRSIHITVYPDWGKSDSSMQFCTVAYTQSGSSPVTVSMSYMSIADMRKAGPNAEKLLNWLKSSINNFFS